MLIMSVSLTACGNFPIGGNGQKPNKPAVTVAISETEAQLYVGDKLSLVAVASDDSEIEWLSDDDEIATVDEFGIVTGVAAGNVRIIATCGKAMAFCDVVVAEKTKPETPVKPGDGEEKPEPQPPVVKPTVSISKTSITIEVGEKSTLTASASDGAEITWIAGNSSIVTVVGGVVTGVAEGKSQVIASTKSAWAACNVTVVAKPPVIDPNPGDVTVPTGYSLVWSDEFNGAALDRTKWNYQTGTQDNYYGNYGPQYWGNNELQYYTDGGNVAVKDGSLEITARRERMGDRDFTSARIVTRDLASWTFGYVEARMKLPKGNGMWPAFWMLPQPPDHSSSTNEYGGWAANGEIDIMEAKGRLMNKVDTTIHFGGSWPENTYSTNETTLSSDIDEWHTYAIEWTADYLRWVVDGETAFYLDNNQWYTTSSSAPSAPFDKPFYILFNFAVGGSYDPAGTDAMLAANTFSSATMYVDYVRVFQKTNSKATIKAVAAAAAPQAIIVKREEY